MLLAFRVQDLVRSAGYPGLFGLVVAENVFPPIPSEVILPFAGYQVQQGTLNFVLALIVATAGSLVGALLLYEVARRGGRPLILRYGRVLRVDARTLERSEERFDRYGTILVLGGRVVPGLRSVVSLPAGLVGMPVLTFAALTTMGSLVWNALLIAGGWALGSRYEQIGKAVGPVSTAIGAALVLGTVAAYLSRRAKRSPA
jgi:membrane protein DedA with SNARE-associated domain